LKSKSGIHLDDKTLHIAAAKARAHRSATPLDWESLAKRAGSGGA